MMNALYGDPKIEWKEELITPFILKISLCAMYRKNTPFTYLRRFRTYDWSLLKDSSSKGKLFGRDPYTGFESLIAFEDHDRAEDFKEICEGKNRFRFFIDTAVFKYEFYFHKVSCPRLFHSCVFAYVSNKCQGPIIYSGCEEEAKRRLGVLCEHPWLPKSKGALLERLRDIACRKYLEIIEELWGGL